MEMKNNLAALIQGESNNVDPKTVKEQKAKINSLF